VVNDIPHLAEALDEVVQHLEVRHKLATELSPRVYGLRARFMRHNSVEPIEAT
jgi:hypothetical protein